MNIVIKAFALLLWHVVNAGHERRSGADSRDRREHQMQAFREVRIMGQPVAQRLNGVGLLYAFFMKICQAFGPDWEARDEIFDVFNATALARRKFLQRADQCCFRTL